MKNGSQASKATSSQTANNKQNQDSDVQEGFASLPEPRPFVPGGEDPRDSALQETVISEETAWQGEVFDAAIMQVELENGKVARRDVAHHVGAVGIIALLEDGRVCVVRQYRPVLDRVTVEIPAGKMDIGETPEQCAHRELLEETGFVAKHMMHLTTLATSPGFTDELIHLYIASELTFEAPNPDEDEFLNVDLIPITEFIDAALDGRIEDAKTVVGALALDAIGSRMVLKEDPAHPQNSGLGILDV